MSASREKKKRQEFLAGGGVDPKAAREAEQKAAEKRSKILYTTVGVLFVVVAAALFVYNSGILQRSKTAVTIGGESYTVAETSYYYQEAYQNFMNQYGSYASLFGLDVNQSLKSQQYSEEQTWDQFFKEQAVDTMRLVYAAKAAAQAENMTLEQAELDTFNANIEAMKSQAAANGYSYKSYLNAVYGATMTASVFESCMKDQLLAYKYTNAYADSLEFTDEEIQAYYEENKNTYDLVDAEYITISGLPETKTDDEGNTIEATEEEKTAAMEAAKAAADEILDAYKSGGDLEKLAEEHDATYSTSTPSASSVCGQWLFDEARTSGDADVIEDESGSRYYVAVFNSRERNEALDYSVRHIRVTGDSLDLPEGETATEEQLTAKAQEILDSWDGTEDGFASLAEEHSKDGGSNTNGGLYENVPKGRMVAPFEDWCYEEGRKAGDTGVVYYSGTGAHVMYFVGYGDTPYWHYACENALRSAAQSEWQTQLTDSVTAEANAGGMKLVG